MNLIKPIMDNSIALVVKAANFAAIKHRRQTRKDEAKTPYIVHPIGVAHILTDLGAVTDADVIAAALLHDTVEDTETTFEELEQEFGKAITELVRECTDDKALPKAERKRLQIEHAPNVSPKAKLVKLADKLYNLRDINLGKPVDWSDDRAHEYFVWSQKVVAGLRGSNQKIEDELDKLFKARLSSP